MRQELAFEEIALIRMDIFPEERKRPVCPRFPQGAV